MLTACSCHRSCHGSQHADVLDDDTVSVTADAADAAAIYTYIYSHESDADVVILWRQLRIQTCLSL